MDRRLLNTVDAESQPAAGSGSNPGGLLAEREGFEPPIPR